MKTETCFKVFFFFFLLQSECPTSHCTQLEGNANPKIHPCFLLEAVICFLQMATQRRGDDR